MRVAVCLCVVLIQTACGTPTRPDNTVASRSNTRPATSHTIANADVSVRFWFDITPAPGSQVSPGTPYSVTLNCEPSQAADYFLYVAVDPWRPDGTVIAPTGASFALGAVNRGVAIRACTAKMDTWLPVQEPFDRVSHLRMRMWLLPSPFTFGPNNISQIQPHMEVIEHVNWTR